MKKKIVIEYDDFEIDEFMAIEALKGLEWDWMKEINGGD
jgi:hypothetical protein